MSKKPKANGLDPLMQELLWLVENNREKLIEAWANSAEIYGRYLTALATARSPADVVAANAEFVRAGVETFSESATAASPLNGGTPAPHMQLVPLPE